jgi:hypothetical protein
MEVSNENFEKGGYLAIDVCVRFVGNDFHHYRLYC